jgi:F-type H+-transporting ATPase subunit gamma
MPGGQERVLKRRIKTMSSTKKITRAMELIAATRIAKAQQRVQAARPYSDQITGVIRSLAAGGAATGQPLLTPKAEVKTVGYIVIAADRGLAGAYNSSVIRQAERAIQADVAAGRNYVLITCGKKAEDYFRFRKYTIAQSFKGFSENPSYENARDVAAAVVSRFEAGELDQVELSYTQFLSAGSQRPVLKRFMPIDVEGASDSDGGGAGYEFEPEPVSILSSLLPRYVESRLYAAMLDAAASEHAARQRAMKSATENAGELIRKLSLQMNAARQAAITTEIMEIVGGAEALKATEGDGSLIAQSTINIDLFEARTSETQQHHAFQG